MALDRFLTSPNLSFLICKTVPPYRVVLGTKQNIPCRVLIKVPSKSIQKMIAVIIGFALQKLAVILGRETCSHVRQHIIKAKSHGSLFKPLEFRDWLISED